MVQIKPRKDYFLPFFAGLDFPALLNAIATACFCDISGCFFISYEMFLEMVFWLEPFLRGIFLSLCKRNKRNRFHYTLLFVGFRVTRFQQKFMYRCTKSIDKNTKVSSVFFFLFPVILVLKRIYRAFETYGQQGF